jgi:hypothetical protein
MVHAGGAKAPLASRRARSGCNAGRTASGSGFGVRLRGADADSGGQRIPERGSRGTRTLETGGRLSPRRGWSDRTTKDRPAGDGPSRRQPLASCSVIAKTNVSYKKPEGGEAYSFLRQKNALIVHISGSANPRY